MNCIDELILPFFRSMGLDTYLLDMEVSELMITSGLVFVERAGKMTEIEGIRIDERKLRAGVEIIGQSLGDQIDDYSKPWLDSRLPDGSRVAATYPKVCGPPLRANRASLQPSTTTGTRCASAHISS